MPGLDGEGFSRAAGSIPNFPSSGNTRGHTERVKYNVYEILGLGNGLHLVSGLKRRSDLVLFLGVTGLGIGRRHALIAETASCRQRGFWASIKAWNSSLAARTGLSREVIWRFHVQASPFRISELIFVARIVAALRLMRIYFVKVCRHSSGVLCGSPLLPPCPSPNPPKAPASQYQPLSSAYSGTPLPSHSCRSTKGFRSGLVARISSWQTPLDAHLRPFLSTPEKLAAIQNWVLQVYRL